MTGAIVLAGTFLALFAAAVLLTRLARNAEKSKKSIGELLAEEKANADLQARNEVLESTPVDGAADRVRKRWTLP